MEEHTVVSSNLYLSVCSKHKKLRTPPPRLREPKKPGHCNSCRSCTQGCQGWFQPNEFPFFKGGEEIRLEVSTHSWDNPGLVHFSKIQCNFNFSKSLHFCRNTVGVSGEKFKWLLTNFTNLLKYEQGKETRSDYSCVQRIQTRGSCLWL